MAEPSNKSTLVPHPCVDPNYRSTTRMGYCTQWTTGLQKCPECEYGVWNLHQPFRISTILVCGYCFDEVQKRGEPDYFQ